MNTNADYTLLGLSPADNDYNPPLPNPHVPPGWTIQSGGGISNMYMGSGYQGPYSSYSSRSDIYGESLPFPQIGSEQATVTNLYDGTGLDKMRPRTSSEMALATEPPYGQTQAAPINYPYGYQIVYDNTSGGGADPYYSKKNENFTSDYELLDSPSTIGIENYTEEEISLKEHGRRKINPILVFVIVVLLFLTLDIWIQTGNYILKKKILKGRKLTSKYYIGLALAASFVLFLVFYFSGLSITWFEEKV